jgi:Fic family protein
MYNNRQELILDYIKENHPVNREMIAEYLLKRGIKASKITILRDIDLFVSNNVVEKTGSARATFYIPSKQSALLAKINVDDYFNEDQDQRSDVKKSFNFDIFPLLSNLLANQEMSDLAVLNETYRQKKALLSPKLLQKEFERLTIELAWKSSKIEGNTYTLLDTERLLKDNVSATGKSAAETQMILNHKTALDFILQDPEYFKELTIIKVELLHQLLTDKLGVEKGIRQGMVGIVGTDYKPLDNAYQIKEALQEFVDIVNKEENPLTKALTVALMIAYIQPFEDGNKRTSRILGNAILLAHDYCPLSYRSVDEVEYKKAVILFYEQNNAFYFKELFLEQFKQAVNKYF